MLATRVRRLKLASIQPQTLVLLFIRPLQLTQVATKWNYGSEESEAGPKQLRSSSLFLPLFTLLALSFSSAVLSSAIPFLAGGRDETNCVIFIPSSHLSLSGRGAHPGSHESTAAPPPPSSPPSFPLPFIVCLTLSLSIQIPLFLVLHPLGSFLL